MVLRPSNAPRWGGGCPGSVALQAAYPDDEDGPDAREGTCAHFWATEALDFRVWPVGTLAPNGHPIDADMITNGQLLLDDVWAAVGQASPTAALRIEQKLTAHGLIHPLNEGTPDVFLCDAVNHRVIVWDYKYGHRDVDPFGNLQLVNYLACVLEAFELTLDDVKGWEIILKIVQPRNFRADPVRSWRMLGWQAWKHIEALAEQAEIAASPNAPTKTGPYCRNCSAAHACQAALDLGAATVDMAGTSIPVDMTPAQLGVTLARLRTAKKRLEALTTSLEEVVFSKIRLGAQVPYWSIGSENPREKWVVTPSEVFAMGDLMGVDLRKPAEAITPNQARERGIDPTVISAYAERPKGAQKLVPIDETTATKAFSQ